ncbi:MAG: glycerol-3-phosphate acyltransferase, partial [Asgard group archaeon]|nr:glycerol-3-phosphate acyltransferase [Asgard group archaeon]
MSINEIWPFIVSPIIGFLLGGFPTAYIVTKLVTGIDPREFGSGSVSTRNTIRAAGLWPWGTIVYGVDATKGMLAATLVEYAIPNTDYTEYYVILAAVFAVVGHCWMPYLGFKGGKGLGTYVGL